jgi:hypothetical protein
MHLYLSIISKESSNYQEYACIMHMEFLFCENSETSPLLNGADHQLPRMVGPRKIWEGSRNKAITPISLNNSHTHSAAVNHISPILAS